MPKLFSLDVCFLPLHLLIDEKSQDIHEDLEFPYFKDASISYFSVNMCIPYFPGFFGLDLFNDLK